jgi:hypothetical protein
MTEMRKTKRKLSNIDFSTEGAHLALVSKDQGGGANGANYALVMKSTNFTDEFVAKAAKIRITMDIEDFLMKFYGLYYDDAEVLARALGFDTAAEDMGESEAEISTYEDYIQSRVDAIEVLKALHEADSIPEVLSKLTEEQYLSVLTDQEKLEKAFKKIDKEKNSTKASTAKDDEGSPEAVAKAEQSVAKTEAKVDPSETVNKGKSMTKEVKTVEKEITVEMVEKSAFETIQKQLDDQKVELQKALDLVKTFEQEKKETIRKARFEQVKTAVKDEAKATVLFKAAGLVEDESEFQAVVKALSDMQAVIEKSDLFVEKGVQVEQVELTKESAVARAVKARLAK